MPISIGPLLGYFFAIWFPILGLAAVIALWRIGTALQRIAAVQERSNRLP